MRSRSGGATHAHMNMRAPAHPHAAVDPDGCCAAHDRKGYRKGGSPRDRRLWRVSGDRPVEPVLLLDTFNSYERAPAGPALKPGTLLRLDHVAFGRYYDGGDHSSTTRRFCVVDGPYAGTCWEAGEIEMTDGSWRYADPVEPVPSTWRAT